MRPTHASACVLGPACALCAAGAVAGEAEILDVLFRPTGKTWDIRVKLRHDDEGWRHYADAWRLRAPDGTVLATRILRHPHVEEQPCTRGLRGVRLPVGTRWVVVEAHDSLHGWSRHTVRVDLRRRSGPRYRVLPVGIR